MPLALDPFETSLVYERLLTVDPRTSNLVEGAAIKLEWIESNTVNFLVKPNNFFHSTDPNTQKLLPVSSKMITEDFNIKNSSKSFFWNTINDKEQGVTYHVISEKIDTGKMLLQK